MTPFDLTQCPPPEGWREWNEVYPHMWSTGTLSPRSVVFVEDWTAGFRVRALTDSEDHYIVTSPADLPSAYRRALQVVGLAPDPEKAALTREVEALRQTVRGCETCGGDGVMMVPAGYNEDEVGDLRPEVCAECHGTCVSSWGQAIDEAAALRAEVEALRAQVAAAPDVLREWPKTVEEAPGEWVLVTRGIPISGEFGTADGRVYFVSWNNESIGADVMDPGEFFVRVP